MHAIDNELLTRTGPGTPMGTYMRQFWFPAMLSSELEAGGAPVRLQVLGERWVAFRTESGAVGVVDHLCAHRCASLFFGRNEEEGIRCVYHGWKYDVTGQCVDIPSEPDGRAFAKRLKLAAARVHEVGGLVWLYLGDEETPPPFPQFDVNQRPAEECVASITLRECNWLQALEGDIDTCHVGFLHLGGIPADTFPKGSINYYRQLDLAPRYEVVETDYGALYDAYRQGSPTETYHRIGQFILPFYAMTPPFQLDSGAAHLRAWVPADDHHVWLIELRHGDVPLTRDADGKPMPGGTIGWDYLPNTSDWLGRWRVKQNAANDYGMDRSRANYTGIDGIPLQDQAITESMGPIQDRTREHLGSSDRMIAICRRRLLREARALADDGAKGASALSPERFSAIRSGNMLRPEGADWLEAYNAYREEWSPGIGPIERAGKPVIAGVE
ncbi:MAG: Rieske 2Fe-2S domain-containing protein [Erythrobacter sp.]|uniref:Rieske 2Fe-2S domain-containing protein n=1 Tax=Erythrobacter sp. TaxID=1042 RepID=UPI00262AA1B2|nr:Rieske 2Fe-2S domain-containing protein [Erythrobacter sp.]MDJ0978154.1 Rieske 2Fe-2S domain-containing protein [Erythrobacter sp.]